MVVTGLSDFQGRRLRLVLIIMVVTVKYVAEGAIFQRKCATWRKALVLKGRGVHMRGQSRVGSESVYSHQDAPRNGKGLHSHRSILPIFHHSNILFASRTCHLLASGK